MAQIGPRPTRHSRGSSTAFSQGETRSLRPEADHPTQDDDATISYIKRVLCARPRTAGSTSDTSTNNEQIADSSEEFLPPLTSSNTLDVQLYAFLAAILNNYVQSWYGRITPDQQFVGQIVQIVAHCTRGLEQRLRTIDLEGLLLDELPRVLVDHLQAVRIAQASWRRASSSAEVELRYHSLVPHAALDPVPADSASVLRQTESEAAWCVLVVDRVLPLLLPPEDIQNPCLDVLVSEIFSQMILRGIVLGKVSEAWLLWEGVTKLIHSLRSGERKSLQTPSGPISRLHEFGLLSAHQASVENKDSHSGWRGRFEEVVTTFWSSLHVIVAVSNLLRALVGTLMQASSTPARSLQQLDGPKSLQTLRAGSGLWRAQSSSAASSDDTSRERAPIIGMQVWTMLGQFVLLDQRMPWLSGFLSLIQWLSISGPGQICSKDSRIDKLLSSYLNDRLCDDHWLPTVLQAIRHAVFPDNALAQARVPPTDDEIVEIKKECAKAVVEVIPHPIRRRFFATQDLALMQEDVEENFLDLFADSYINKHLIVCVAELLLARVFPELTAQEP